MIADDIPSVDYSSTAKQYKQNPLEIVLTKRDDVGKVTNRNDVGKVTNQDGGNRFTWGTNDEINNNHSSIAEPTQSQIPHHGKEPGPFELPPPQEHIEQLHFSKLFETGGTNTPIEVVNMVHTVDGPHYAVQPTVKFKEEVDESCTTAALPQKF